MASDRNIDVTKRLLEGQLPKAWEQGTPPLEVREDASALPDELYGEAFAASFMPVEPLADPAPEAPPPTFDEASFDSPDVPQPEEVVPIVADASLEIDVEQDAAAARHDGEAVTPQHEAVEPLALEPEAPAEQQPEVVDALVRVQEEEPAESSFETFVLPALDVSDDSAPPDIPAEPAMQSPQTAQLDVSRDEPEVEQHPELVRPAGRPPAWVEAVMDDRPGYSGFEMDDMLGMGRHAAHQNDEDLGSQRAVEENLEFQDRQQRYSQEMTRTLLEMNEQLIVDNHHDYMRANDVLHAFVRSRNTVTDRNVG